MKKKPIKILYTWLCLDVSNLDTHTNNHHTKLMCTAIIVGFVLDRMVHYICVLCKFVFMCECSSSELSSATVSRIDKTEIAIERHIYMKYRMNEMKEYTIIKKKLFSEAKTTMKMRGSHQWKKAKEKYYWWQWQTLIKFHHARNIIKS